jgi:iron complex outermembrane receptor protein
VEYRVAAEVFAFTSIAKGFKSGGFNARTALNLPNLGYAAYLPETALTYELGVRSEWHGRRLRLNATVFRTEYRDVQLRQQTLAAGVPTTLIENAARARIDGAEVELMARPVRWLTLGAAYGYLDARYLEIGRVPGLTLGTPFQRTPHHSLALFVDGKWSLGGGTIQAHADYGYRSREQFQITPAINDQPGYGLVGARLAFRPLGDKWQFAAFATNLTDKRYRTAGRGTLLTQTGIAYSSVGMPRQVGIQLTRLF